MNDKRQASFRLSDRVLDDMQTEADKENRNLTNMVETALREWLRGRGYDY